MLDQLTPLASAAIVALGVIFALWTFFLLKIIFLGKPRDVKFKAFGVEINISPPTCETCGSARKP